MARFFSNCLGIYDVDFTGDCSGGTFFEVPKLDVASAFEEAVCVEGKQLEAYFGGNLLADLGAFFLTYGAVHTTYDILMLICFDSSPGLRRPGGILSSNELSRCFGGFRPF